MSEENGTIEFNKDELTPPDFINEEFFENVLRTAECDKALKVRILNSVNSVIQSYQSFKMTFIRLRNWK